MRGSALLFVVVVATGCSTAQPVPPPEPAAEDRVAAAPDEIAEPSPEPVTETQTPAPAPEQPNPVAVRINEKYQSSKSAKGWERKFERQGREVHDRRDAILEALNIEPGSSVADVGVGSGLYTLSFAEAVGPRGTVFGVDVQDYFLEHVEKKARESGAENVRFVRAEQRSANLDPGSVDLVFMCDVFHHVEYPRTYLASLYDALEPGGRFAVIDYIAQEGTSEAWVLEHVRASPAEFRAEFEAAGFVFEESPDLLQENFFHVYRKPDA